MEEDNIAMDDDRKMTVTIWEMTVLIWDMLSTCTMLVVIKLVLATGGVKLS